MCVLFFIRLAGGTFVSVAGTFPECTTLEYMAGTFCWPPCLLNHGSEGTFVQLIEN
jgi:hypothetical protein